MTMVKKIAVALVAMVMMISMTVPAFAAGTTVKLINMHETESERVEIVDSITDSYGNSYSSNVLKMDASYDSYISYDLNGEYKSFTGSVVCSTDTGSGASMNIGVFADGKLIYSATDITRQKAAKEISVDLSGVGTLEIKTSNSGEFSYGWLFLVDSTFEKADKAEDYYEWAKLSDNVAIDTGRGYEYRVGLSKDVMGNLHNGSIQLDASYDAYVLYNLNAQYVSFTGSLITFPETGNGANMTVSIYADDQKVFSKSGITKQSSAIDVKLDVTGVKVLKIESSNEGEFSYGRVFLVDDILSKHIHSLNDWVVTTDATCTENGEKIQTCKDCGETVKTEEISAIGHTAESKWTIVTDATCTEKGEQIHKCTVCGDTADKEVIEAKGHTANGSWEYGDDGTCNKVQKCTVCGDVALRQTDEEAEHTLSGEWTITREARCDAEGEQVQYCTICNEVGLAEAIPTTEHDYGKWATISGSVWNNPIVKERTCSICGDVEHVESNSTSWLKPLVIVLFVIIFGGLAVIIVTLKMNGLALEPASIKKLFSKESLTDDDIDDILNKPDDNSDNQ